MSHRVRCSICDGIAVDHCSICKRPVCSICMNGEGICKRCAMHGYDVSSRMDDSSSNEDSRSSFRIGYTALRDIANVPMLLVGIGVIMIGMLLISYASMSMVDMLNQTGQEERLGDARDAGGAGGRGGGIVVIFPFPFLILVQDAGVLALIMLIVILVPFILFFLLLRRGLRVP